jgi:hypothetical protein
MNKLEHNNLLHNHLVSISIISFSVVCSLISVGSIDPFIQQATEAAALSSDTASTTALTLGNPFYQEYDKTTSQKALVINRTIHASEVTFSGHGMAKGVNFTDNGKAVIMPRGSGGAILIQGRVNIMSSSGIDKSSFDFKELGHANTNGIVKANGAAFFDPNATGTLSFLSNTVVIYTDEIDKAGNGKVVAWEWNK